MFIWHDMWINDERLSTQSHKETKLNSRKRETRERPGIFGPAFHINIGCLFCRDSSVIHYYFATLLFYLIFLLFCPLKTSCKISLFVWCNLTNYKTRPGRNVDACSVHSIFQFHDEVNAHAVIFSVYCGGLQICSHTLLMVEK